MSGRAGWRTDGPAGYQAQTSSALRKRKRTPRVTPAPDTWHPPWGPSGSRGRWRCAASGRPTSARPSRPRACRSCGQRCVDGSGIRGVQWLRRWCCGCGRGLPTRCKRRRLAHPLGRPMMKAWALEARAAAWISSRLAPGLPYRMFSGRGGGGVCGAEWGVQGSGNWGQADQDACAGWPKPDCKRAAAGDQRMVQLASAPAHPGWRWQTAWAPATPGPAARAASAAARGGPGKGRHRRCTA